MNGPAESVAVVESKRSTSPRPPAVGEEDRNKKFNETSQPYPENYKNWNMDYQTKPSECVRSATPSCAEQSDSLNGSPNHSPLSPNRWAQSLLCLLEDIEGVSLFEQFLKQEGQDTRCLSFWFACRGVKKHDPNDKDGLFKLINVVFVKKIKRISAISAETKEEIKRRLITNDVDDTIFDAAQREVEAYIANTTYPNFLKSDLYIQHLGSWQSEFSVEKVNQESSESNSLLPTVHEDTELQIVTKPLPLTKGNLLQRNKLSSVTRLKSECPAGYLKNPYNVYSSYHSKNGSYSCATAQDSELQSLSSDAQTDDTMSLTDSSVGDFPMHSRSKQKKQQKLSKRNLIINRDDGLSHGAFIPRTDRLPQSMQPKTMKELHTLLVKKLNKILEEERKNEKIFEKLKAVENAENSKPDVVSRSTCKPSQAPVFDLGFLCESAEENVHDILDQHIDRVFGQRDSGQQTPAMSSGCMSPPGARPGTGLQVPTRNCDPSSEAFEAQQKYQISVPNSMKHRRDHDTHSTDSAMFDYVSDDNMPSSYKSHYSSTANSDLIDYSQRSREHSKRYISKKLSSVADSSSSCVDSGISLGCESEPSYSKLTYWLETRKISDAEREHVWRNSSTSPVLSRSSRKAIMYNSAQSAGQDVGCSQWSTISTHIIARNSCLPCYPSGHASNLIEARRLDDENRSKLKLKKMSRKSYPVGGYETSPVNTTSNDVTVIGYSYGRHSVPYLSKLPGKNIILRQFKSLLSKKGNFRYFFKTASNDFGTGVVFEEITDDYKVLPLWEGKVFCVIESMDDSPGM